MNSAFAGETVLLKLMLVLALIVTQFLTWGAVPVYLCLGCDGSVRLDLGPSSCPCGEARGLAHETAGDDACCCETHATHPAGDDSCSVGDLLSVNEPCSDCIHIMVSAGEQSFIGTTVTVVDPGRLLTCVVAWPVDCAWRIGLVKTDRDLPDRPSTRAPSLSLTILRSVNLRC